MAGILLDDLNYSGGSSKPTTMTYAEYQALTTQEKNDGTERYVTGYPNNASIIDDTSTSENCTWSASKINNKIGKTMSITTGLSKANTFKTDGNNIYMDFYVSDNELYRITLNDGGISFVKYSNGQGTVIWSK